MKISGKRASPTLQESINIFFDTCFHPYYLPREFTAVTAVSVYIPLSGNDEAACDVIHGITTRLQTKYPEAFITIRGDFNHIKLSSTLLHLPSICLVHNQRRYADAYSSVAPLLLSRSDRNLVLLTLTYRPVVMQLWITTRTVASSLIKGISGDGTV